MQTLDDALNEYQHVTASLPSGTGHIEVSYHDDDDATIYYWVRYRGNSIKPEDADWCYSWEELEQEMRYHDIDVEEDEIWSPV